MKKVRANILIFSLYVDDLIFTEIAELYAKSLNTQCI